MLAAVGTVDVRPTSRGNLDVGRSRLAHCPPCRRGPTTRWLDVCLLHDRILGPAFGVTNDQGVRPFPWSSVKMPVRVSKRSGRSVLYTVALALHATNVLGCHI